MKKSLFEYRNYKPYVRDTLEQRGQRGERSRLASALHCHTAYVSQVLNGQAEFSLEQADGINEFFGHNREQSLFFLLLVQLARAGTPRLRGIFETQINEAVEKQLVLKNRLEFKRTLSAEDQSTFYSSWHYGAVHVLVSVPGCNNEKGISDYLGIPLNRISEIVQFLLSVGLIVRKGDRLDIGTTHIHLGNESPTISKHHTNWRMRGIQSFDEAKSTDLHYSSVITASREDGTRIRQALVDAIESVRGIVKPSKDEEAFCYSLDFFGLRKT